MFVKLAAILVAGVLFSLLNKADAGCVFDVVNNKTEDHQPVLLYNVSSDYQLAIPSKGFIYLEPGHNISLLCSGIRNYVRQTNANISTVTCIDGNRVKLFRKEYNFYDIKCRHNVRGEVRAKNVKCSNNGGKVYLIGYPPSRVHWVTLISACYIPEVGQTLYTKHVIHGKEIQYKSKRSSRPDFSTEGQQFNITVTTAYNKAFQKSTFSSILRSSRLAELYIKGNSFLAKGHLSPDADFILASAQYSTYYYINTAPQWQSINGGSWKSVEATVRNLAPHYGDLEIITGTYGILEYNDINDKPQKIFLGRDGILPVPKYFWKTVYDARTKKAIAFIALNDPYINPELVENEVFCKDICEECGFLKKSWKDPSSGYVFCCDIHDFRKHVRDLPSLHVSSVLTDPSRDSEPVQEYWQYNLLES